MSTCVPGSPGALSNKSYSLQAECCRRRGNLRLEERGCRCEPKPSTPVRSLAKFRASACRGRDGRIEEKSYIRVLPFSRNTRLLQQWRRLRRNGDVTRREKKVGAVGRGAVEAVMWPPTKCRSCCQKTPTRTLKKMAGNQTSAVSSHAIV